VCCGCSYGWEDQTRRILEAGASITFDRDFLDTIRSIAAAEEEDEEDEDDAPY
jgi:hypothetical protein